MHVLLDHLSAILIGGTVVLVLLGVTLAGQSDSVQQTLRQGNEQLARTLGEMMEDDIRNAGSGVPASQQSLIAAFETTLSIRLKEDFGDSPLRTITYRRSLTGTVASGGAEVPVYALQREVDGVVTQRVENVSELAFELRDASGAATTDLAAGRAVHVRLTVGLPPAGGSEVDVRARYRRSIQMPNLFD